MAYNAKTNWQLNDVVKPEDMIRIEQGIKDLDVNKLTKTAIIVNAGEDLNNFTSVGIYTWSRGASSSIINCPVVSQATMLSIPRLVNYTSAAQNLTQIVISQGPPIGMYIRILTDNVWTQWTKFTGSDDFASIAKYNLATATKTSSGTVESTVNPIPTTWTQVNEGSHYEQSGFVIKCGDYAGSSGAAAYVKNAFDGNLGSRWISSMAVGNTWISIELPEAQIVKSFKLTGSVQIGTANKLAIEGSANGIAWTELYSNGNLKGAFDFTATISSNTAYKHYRILTTLAEQSGGFAISEVKITSILVTNFSKAYTAGNAPAKWENYQRYMIQIPSTPDSIGVTTNTFMGIEIDTILQPGRKYELMYLDNKFYAREVV